MIHGKGADSAALFSCIAMHLVMHGREQALSVRKFCRPLKVFTVLTTSHDAQKTRMCNFFSFISRTCA